MSADNGIYILQLPTKADQTDNNLEWHVTHAQAIDNLTYNNPEGNPLDVVNYYQNAPVFHDYHQAMAYAEKLASEVLNDDFAPILEYGICLITLPHTWEWYLNQAMTTHYDNEWEREIQNNIRETLKK